MSIFSSLIPEAHPNRNVFDLSHRDVFSLKTGMLTPCFVQHTIPNADYQIKPYNQVEVSPMAKANFARMSQNIEYYFVPYSQIWRWFETFYYERTDAVRSPSNERVPVVPTSNLRFDATAVLNNLGRQYVNYLLLKPLIDIYNSEGRQTDAPSVSDSEALVSSIPNLLTYPEFSVDVHGRVCFADMLRNLDMLGYGNHTPIIQSYFEKRMSEITFIVSSGSSATAAVGGYEGYLRSIRDLIDAQFSPNYFTSWDDFVNSISSLAWIRTTDFPDGVSLSTFVSSSPLSPSIYDNVGYLNPYPILGYLKIFSDNFRSVQYDDENYSYFYNMDYLSGYTPLVPVERILEALKPRYRLYKRDILTGTYPNAQFGDVAVASTTDKWYDLYNRVPAGSISGPTASIFTGAQQNGKVQVNYPTTSGTQTSTSFTLKPNPAISALAIRQAEALQRYKEKNLRAGSRIKNQQNAFFGDSSQFIQDDYSRYISSADSQILINSVVATGESADINLGDKGSTAASVLQDNGFTFHSHDFGVIIGIMYIIPQAEYENYGFDPHVTKIENGDYFHPDFQNLGLSPVDNRIVDLFDPTRSQQSISNLRVLGYSAHDWEYKTSLDRVHGEFNTYNGVFGDYVTPRDSKDFSAPLLSSLYINPSDVDSIFYNAADLMQSSDQFKVNLYHEIKAVLPMSVTGLPY